MVCVVGTLVAFAMNRPISFQLKMIVSHTLYITMVLVNKLGHTINKETNNLNIKDINVDGHYIPTHGI